MKVSKALVKKAIAVEMAKRAKEEAAKIAPPVEAKAAVKPKRRAYDRFKYAKAK